MHDGKPIQISITTGDYQLTEDFLGSPPPDAGEIVICTPERLEVMLRNAENHDWARAVSTYVIDEFHLLGEGERGGRVECLITRLFTACPWSSVIGLSATIGGIAHIRKWFEENGRTLKEVVSEYRFPRLFRKVVLTEDKEGFVQERTRAVLKDPDRGLLVFVYRKADAVKLASVLGDLSGQASCVGAFHAGFSRDQKQVLMERFRKGEIRVLVTTTSLKMGVNFPVTDVIVRDTLFYGSGRLLISDILQMMGRAGRGNVAGNAWVLCEDFDAATEYQEGLSSGRLDDLVPQLGRPNAVRTRADDRQREALDPLRGLILTELTVRKKASVEEVGTFLGRTYTASRGELQVGDLAGQFGFLETGKLIYKIEGSEATYSPTKLGRTVSLTGICPESGATLAGFLRALIRLSEKKVDANEGNPRYLARLTDLDFLFLALASFETRSGWIRECMGVVPGLVW